MSYLFSMATPEFIRPNQQDLAQAIALAPRPLTRYEAQAMMLLASHGGRYRQQARAALWLASQAAGRQNGPTVTREPRLNKATTARLAFWATDEGAEPVSWGRAFHRYLSEGLILPIAA